ncbi:MAG: DUF934 domain-containing protein [Candidatus Puniceispirillaceae bacterium]|jgi:uncharacterized protein (DUF934 family)
MQVFSFAPATLVDLPPPRLQLESGEEMPATDILQNLSAEDVVAVCFGKFSDGRGFSLGRRLRSSLSRDHLIVASGHIIPDQADYLRRVGFSHAVISSAALPQWQKSLTAVTQRFQTAGVSPRTRGESSQ